MYLGGLNFITDGRACRLSYEEMTGRVLKSRVKWIQLRDKDRSRRAIYEEALRLRAVTGENNAVLVINDHADIALAVNADGVHLGQDDLPLKEARRIMGVKKIIGISTHSLQQARDAEEGGADYIGFGPVFFTKTKDAGSPMGIDMLAEIKKAVGIPVVAIGGINLENLKAVLETGADAVAVASAILCGDIEGNTEKFLGIINSYKV